MAVYDSDCCHLGGGTKRDTSAAGKAPPTLDTSGWQTHTSSHGFAFDYPPDWTLDEPSDQRVRVMNPVYAEAIDDAIQQGHVGVGLPPVSGMADFNVIAVIAPGFDLDYLLASCTYEAELTTFRNLQAVRCLGSNAETASLQSTGRGFWVEYPPGHTMLVGGSVFGTYAAESTAVNGILDSFRFIPTE